VLLLFFMFMFEVEFVNGIDARARRSGVVSERRRKRRRRRRGRGRGRGSRRRSSRRSRGGC